jgi:septin family protein
LVYFLPAFGPSKVDLAVMSALSQHVALLPAISIAPGMTPQEVEHCKAAIMDLLLDPEQLVPGLQPINTFQ